MPTAPITARSIKTGWLYEQAGTTVRKSGKGGPAYPFAVMVDDSVVSFGTLASANREASRYRRGSESCAATLAKYKTLEAYRTGRYNSDLEKSNRAFTEKDGRLAQHMEWFERTIISDWESTVRSAVRVVAVVPITVVV